MNQITTIDLDEVRWRAVCERNAEADGTFVFAVRTTGIYCRPSCPARRAKRGNVRFFGLNREAEAAGFRPCKRCRPNEISTTQAHALAVEAACRRLATAEVEPSLEELAAFGMTPTVFRAGAQGEAVVYAAAETSLGIVTAAFTRQGVCAVRLTATAEEGVTELKQLFPAALLIFAQGDFESLVNEVAAAVEEPRRARELPLDIRGTAFQQRVWKALRAIPIGTRASYSEIAVTIGAPTSQRAVAQACGANPVAVLVPCHRVVRADGSLGGYRWGVERKRDLLVREAAG